MRLPCYFGSLLAIALAACGSPAAQQPAAPADTAKPIVAQVVPTPPASTYPYTLPPVDQTAQYPTLQAFVRRVLRACAARRQADLLALVSDSVAVSYGGGISGKAGFVSDFLSNDGGGYDKLPEAIRLGGTVQRDPKGRLTATYPYLQDGSLYERNELLAKLKLDPYNSFVGLSANVPIYSQPTTASPLLARLRYPILLTSEDAPRPPGDWLQVMAADSSFRGYTQESQLYFLGSMTLTIESHGAGFWITSVAPYD